MWRKLARTVVAEGRRLEVHVEPTRLILLFCLLFMLPRYHRFVWVSPWLTHSLVFQLFVPVAIILVVYREDPLKWGLGI